MTEDKLLKELNKFRDEAAGSKKLDRVRELRERDKAATIDVMKEDDGLRIGLQKYDLLNFS